MKILGLEGYYGGSHKAFIDGWMGVSGHDWTLLTLAGYKWKWRMRHGAVTFADDVRERVEVSEGWDLIFCSDMLNLAEFIGLAPGCVRGLPSVVYFHENQLTYPVRHESERDYQFGMTNITTALAAEAVWFNSEFHRESFLDGVSVFLKKMPDYRPMEAIEKIRAKSAVYPVGINRIERQCDRSSGPLRILWAARWEHDKRPEEFFEALKLLKSRGAGFRVSVVGEEFRERPGVFDWAKDYFSNEIDRWGYQQKRSDYEGALLDADVIVSTAGHEFFGISVVEAIGAGAYPVLPRRLSYPEILGGACGAEERYFYDGGVEGLAVRLAELAKKVQRGGLWADPKGQGALLVERFTWEKLGSQLDEAILSVRTNSL